MAANTEEKRFKKTTRAMVLMASLFAFLAIFTSWIDRQVLDTDEWTATSGRLLEDKKISDAVADYAVEQLFANVDVSNEIKTRLPEKAKPLAAPASAGVRQLAYRIAQDALRTARLQAAWEQANETAHSQLVAILEDKSSAVSTGEGEVVLDLRPMVEQLATRVGADKDLVDKIPPDVAHVEIVRSDQLKTAQKVTKLLKGLDLFFTIGSLLFFAGAAYLARGRRWEIVLGYGLGLIVSGVLALVLRKVIGGVVVDQLVTDETVRGAAEHGFAIATDLLKSIAKTVVGAGVLFVVAAFLASPARGAVQTRRVMAPTFNERPALVWGGFSVLVILLLIAAPPNSASELWARLFMVLLGLFGLEALGRKIHHEFPDAKKGDLRERVRERIRELGAEGAKRTRAALGDLGDMMERERDPEDARLERLAKLGELRDSGVLTDAEFDAEKQRMLTAPQSD
jgi:putative oligomerization/nucleic acid binding protein